MVLLFRGTTFFILICNKVCHDIQKDFSKCFSLPIRILVSIKVLKPGKAGHAPFKESYVCPVIMPNFPQKVGEVIC